MAERSGFFNAQETSAGVYDRTYNAEDFSNVFRQFLGNGIMVSEEEINSNSVYDKTTCNGLKPTKSGNNIQMNTGYAFINGYWYYNDEILTIPINSEGTLVLEYSSSERKISLKIITGNLQKNDDIYDISIALIQSSGTSYTVTDSRSQFITTNLKAIQNLTDNSVNKFYPVGSVYTSVNDVDPSTLFSGTWEKFAAGRTLVGVDTGQAEFNTVKKSGGDKTVTLTINQMPGHNHTISGGTCTTGNNGNHSHTVSALSRADNVALQAGNNIHGNLPVQAAGNITSSTTGSHNHSVPAHSHTASNVGGGQAHNNLQPYITVYFWVRTA